MVMTNTLQSLVTSSMRSCFLVFHCHNFTNIEKTTDLNMCFSTVLYCTVLYCTVLYCTVLYYTVLYCIVLYCTGGDSTQPIYRFTEARSPAGSGEYQSCSHCTIAFHIFVQYSTVQYSTVQYSTVQYSTVQYSTVQYSTVQYSTVQFSQQQEGKLSVMNFIWAHTGKRKRK